MTSNGHQNNDYRTGDSRLSANVTCFEISPYKTCRQEINEEPKSCINKKVLQTFPTFYELKQYAAVSLCVLSIWVSAWLIFGPCMAPGGVIFNMSAMVVMGYVFGHTLERYTSINPIVGMTLVGALYRRFGPPNFLQNSTADVIDYHLRRIYPVIILTKGPLSWNWEYIRHNPVKVFSLATVPWIVECLSTAFFAHILLEYPWYWGLHLGSILASVSSAVVIPYILALNSQGLGSKNQIAQLVINAGSLDTAFTEGVCGVINSAIFYPTNLTYRITKASLAIFMGIGIGVVWGIICDYLPDHEDPYAPTIRSLHIFTGGLLLTYGGSYLGWGGTSGVAIMVCAGVAATRWARRDWRLNDNPVSEVYKLLWRIFEPMLFTLSGYFLEMSVISWKEFALIVGCIMSALFLRLVTALLVSLANGLSVREAIFIAVTWIPKAIVEAVLVRTATDSLWQNKSYTPLDKRIAEQHSNIIVIAILITSTLGSIFTKLLGPILLSQETRVAPEEFYRTQTLSAPQSGNANRRHNTPCSMHTVDI